MDKTIKLGLEASIEITTPPGGKTKKASLSIFDIVVAHVVRDIETPDSQLVDAVKTKFAGGIAKAVVI